MKLLYTLNSQVYLQTYYYYNNYGSPIFKYNELFKFSNDFH